MFGAKKRKLNARMDLLVEQNRSLRSERDDALAEAQVVSLRLDDAYGRLTRAFELMEELRERSEAAEANLLLEREAQAASRFEALIRKRVSLHTTDDNTLEGYVDSIHPDAVVLIQARYYMPEGATEILVGPQVIPREKVSWVAELPASSG